MELEETTAVHPLAAAFSRITELTPNHYSDLGALEDGWFPASDLLKEDSPALETALARQATDYPQMEIRTRGSYFIGEYTYYVPIALIAGYLTMQRVPDFSLENIAIRFGKYTWHSGEHSGEANRLEARFLSNRFAVLAGDPAADHPDAIVLADKAAMREWIRASLETHITPLVDRIAAVTRLGRSAQWNLVADACASLFLSVGQNLGIPDESQAEGMSFIKSPDSIMKSARTHYVTLHYEEHADTFCSRGGCCRYYTVAENAHKCSTCVMNTPEERDERLLGYMKWKYTQPQSAS